MQRVNDISWQTVVKKEPKDVVAVMSGSLKPYFYFVRLLSTVLNRLQQPFETIRVVGDGEAVSTNRSV